MVVLPKVIGDFVSDREWNIDLLKEELHSELKELDHAEFINLEENGDILFDSIVLINYEQYTNSNNRIYIYLDVNKDDEGYFAEYGIGLSIDNNIEYFDNIPFNEEERLFDNFYNIVKGA